MINIYSMYDNMHRIEMFYALICINNHVILSVSYLLFVVKYENSTDAGPVYNTGHTPYYKG